MPVLLLVALLLALVGWYGLSRYRQGVDHAPPQAQVTLPTFEFPDLDGRRRNSDTWRGRILVLNFWATWCPPCREEMPRFIAAWQAHRAQGVEVVAIAIDDPDMVRDFVDVYGIGFPVLVGGAPAVELASTLGNRFNTLPFTVIFDRQGRRRYQQVGEISAETLEGQLQSLLQRP